LRTSPSEKQQDQRPKHNNDHRAGGYKQGKWNKVFKLHRSTPTLVSPIFFGLALHRAGAFGFFIFS